MTDQVDSVTADAWIPDGLLPVVAVNDVEAARLFGVSTRTWQRLDADGDCPMPVRFGKLKRWIYADLAAWGLAGCPARPRWLEMRGRK